MTAETAVQRARLTITHPTGLHARPAVKLTKLAKGFDAEIGIAAAAEGPWIDAKSIVKVMALKLKTGTEIELEATGETAADAVEALSGLVTRDFDEHG